jgi:putative acetyltransferase
MMMILDAMIVRSETPEDQPAVYEVIAAAFSQIVEANLVDSLRANGDLEVSLVAEHDHEIIAHLALSKMNAPFRALALAPVSVIPPRQRQGIGTRLVRDALSRAKEAGWEAAFVLGEPKYYQRFGFSVEAARGFSSPYAGQHFMGLLLAESLSATTGDLRHPLAFDALA